MLVSLQTRACQSINQTVRRRINIGAIVVLGVATFQSVPDSLTAALAQNHTTTMQLTSSDNEDSRPSELSGPGANGTARIDNGFVDTKDGPPSRMSATFAAQPLPPAPSAPQSILMPQSPTEDSFTHADEEGGIGMDNEGLTGDRGEFSGTFAAQAPPVRQFGNLGNFDRPEPDNGTRFSDESNPNRVPFEQNELRGGFGDHSMSPSEQEYSNRSTIENEPNYESSSPPQYQPQRSFNTRPIDSTIYDSRVEPATFNQVVPSQEPNTELAKQLVERYLVNNAPDPLPGQPTKLLDMLKQPVPSNRRQAMVSQYWETWYDWSSLLSRAEYVNWLGSISNPASPTEVALLRAAKSAAANQMLAAEIQLGKSQAKLMDFLPTQSFSGNSIGNSILPLPSDQPLIQKYNTNYDLYLSHQIIPARLRGIDVMLPKTLGLICDRANTIQLAYDAAENARNAFAARQADLTSVLEAGRIWRGAEQDLIASVTSYNQAIADYSLSVTNGSQAPETIVAMLISTPRQNNGAIQNSFNQQTADSQIQSFGTQGQFGQPATPNRNNPPVNRGLQPLTESGQMANTANGMNGNRDTLNNRSFPNTNGGFNPNQNSAGAGFGGRPGSNFGSPASNTASGQFGNRGFESPSQSNFGPSQPPTRAADASFGQPSNEFGR